MWTYVMDKAALDAAMKLARGVYQRALLSGEHNLSGSTLKGKAFRYCGRYARSRANLLARMTKAGIPWYEVKGTHGKRVLVIG